MGEPDTFNVTAWPSNTACTSSAIALGLMKLDTCSYNYGALLLHWNNPSPQMLVQVFGHGLCKGDPVLSKVMTPDTCYGGVLNGTTSVKVSSMGGRSVVVQAWPGDTALTCSAGTVLRSVVYLDDCGQRAADWGTQNQHRPNDRSRSVKTWEVSEEGGPRAPQRPEADVLWGHKQTESTTKTRPP